MLGQGKPVAAPVTSSGVTPPVPFFPSGGAATVGDNGLIFPGTVGESTNYPQHSFTSSVRVPDSVKDNFVRITANVFSGSSGVAQLKIKVTGNTGLISGGSDLAVDNVEQERTITINAGTSGVYTLFSGKVAGADTIGNSLQIEISRTPGDGTDTATYDSVIVNNVQVGINRYTTDGRSLSSQMSYSNK